jgi:tetratricopeptide (TPR) repeat protein
MDLPGTARPTCQALLALACAAAISIPALAFKPKNVSAGELAMLPEYCIDTEAFIYGSVGQAGQSPRAPEWVALMGPSFATMHHYCWGLVNLNRLRAGRAETNNKQYFARGIVDEYLYVISNSRPGFVLLPEIWTRIGEASLLAGDVGQALDAYAMARRLKPDYWPAYTQWAEFLLKLDKKAEARELVRAGLAHAPESVSLIDMYRKLGGDPKSVPRAAHGAASAASAAALADAPASAASAP